MKRSESIASIAKALAQFQKEVVQPEKSAKNPHFKSMYVPLDNVVKSIADTAPKYGLSYIQTTVTENDKAGVQTLLMHESGEWMEFEPFMLPIGQKSTPQAVGSAITYARRYTLSSVFGIASEADDDGNTASDNAKNNPSPPRTQAPPKNNKPVASEEMKETIRSLVKVLSMATGEEQKDVFARFKITASITPDDATRITAALRKAVDEAGVSDEGEANA